MTIDDFQEKIMRLKQDNFVGLSGGGTGRSEADIVLQLQRAVIEFTKLYKVGNVDAVKMARREVTAKIMVAHTLDILSEKEADELLDVLVQLMKERNK